MASAARDEDDEKPLDPAVEKVRRKLLRFVVINLGLLFLALIVVVVALVYKTRTDQPAVALPPAAEIPGTELEPVWEGAIELPAGARIVSQALSESRLSLEIALPDGAREIRLFDLRSGRMAGRFRIAAP